MSGILGIINRNKTTFSEFRNSLSSIKSENSYHIDQVIKDEKFFAGRVHQGIINSHNIKPFERKMVTIWLYGEVYFENKIDDNEFYERIYISYINHSLEKDLKNFNGVFTFLIRDEKNGKFLLVNDRFGLSRMHIYFQNNLFAYSADIKAFSFLSDVTLKVNPDNLKCFLDLGHFLGQNTYFENINLFPPATIATYNLSDGKVTFTKYWKWSDIKKNKIDYVDSKNILYNIFKKSISIRQSKNQILSLSGGLDSRAIFSESDKNIITYSYGSQECLDVRIAKKLTNINGNEHVFFDLSSDDWFLGKPEGIWKNDGMSSCFHMHFSKYHQKIGQLGSINQNGFLGDLVLGGSYLFFNKLNQRIDTKTARRKFGRNTYLSNLNDDYYDFESTDPYFIYNRGVRFTLMGSIESSRFIEHRNPFLDYNLIDFVYSLSDTNRWMSKLYNRFLLDFYPNYFKEIPWQRTGLIISPSPFVTLLQLGNKAKKHLLYKLHLKRNHENYTDYKAWICNPSFVKTFEDLNKNAIYKDIINLDKKFLLEEHLNHSKNNTQEIGNLITAEIYLQQIYNNKYMSSIDFNLSNKPNE